MTGLMYWTGVAVLGIALCAFAIGLYRLGFALNEWRKGNGLRWM
ncbi:hypothetical protein [Thermomonas mangrovi]|nr:hypothetical protein [Thermomonas mangrovi]